MIRALLPLLLVACVPPEGKALFKTIPRDKAIPGELIFAGGTPTGVPTGTPSGGTGVPTGTSDTGSTTTLDPGAPAPHIQNCALFDGYVDRIVGSDAGLPEDAAPRTVEFWMRLGYGGFSQAVVYGQNAIGRTYIAGVENQLTFSQQTGLVQKGATTVSDDQWHHVAFVHDGLNVSFYVDGALDNTLYAPTGTLVGGQLIFGSSLGPGNPWPGWLTELRIWDYALDPTEIETARTTAMTGTEPGLLLAWSLDNPGIGSGISVPNHGSGSGLDGLTEGSTAIVDCSTP